VHRLPRIKGYQASFPEVYRVPKIAGQGAKYIAAALNAYKTGERKHPTMRSIAESLTEQDIADVSAYYEKLGAEDRKPLADKPNREPDSQVAVLVQKAPAPPATARTCPSRSTRAIPRSPARTTTTCSSPSRPTRRRTTRTSAAPTGVMGAIAKQFSNAELKAPGELRGLARRRGARPCRSRASTRAITEGEARSRTGPWSLNEEGPAGPFLLG
jgi:hypothetical protein